MDKETKSQCMLCGIEYATGVVYASEHGRRSRGRHHLFPRRFEKRGMSQEGLARKLDVETRDLGFVHLCYECHEELLHNPVLTIKMLDELSHLIKGKSLEDKVVTLSRIIELGIKGAMKGGLDENYRH